MNARNEESKPFHIHGTTASMLRFLPFTDFQMKSGLELLHVCNISPYSGEIFNGGYLNPFCDGRPAFGVAMDDDELHPVKYGMDEVIQGYAHEREGDDRKLDAILEGRFRTTRYQKVHVLMFVLLAAYQEGKDVSEHVNYVLADLNYEVNFLRACKFLLESNYFIPDKNDYAKFDDMVHDKYMYSPAKCYEEQKQQEIKIESVDSAVEFLFGSDKEKIKGMLKKRESEIIEKDLSRVKQSYFNNANYSRVMHCVQRFLSFDDEKLKPKAIKKYRKEALDLPYYIEYLRRLIELFEANIVLLNKIKENEIAQVEEDKSVCDLNFPMIIVLDKPCDKLEIFNEGTQEYRLKPNETLEFGRDIKKILVGCDKDKTALENFFKKNEIDMEISISEKLGEIAKISYEDLRRAILAEADFIGRECLIGSQKSNNISRAIDAIKNPEDISSAIRNCNSELYKALNTKRYGRFSFTVNGSMSMFSCKTKSLQRILKKVNELQL